jgi:hypothetical protein
LYNLVMDTSSGHIFVIGAENYLADSSSTVLSAYGQSSLALTDALAFPQVQIPTSQSLLRWGTDGFAFLAQNPSGNAEAIYVLTSSMAASTTSNPVPQISSISPSSTPQGGSGLQLTLDGQGFVEGSVVQWNSTALQTTYVSNSILNASLPATDVGSSGTASLLVSNPVPGGGTSNAVSFTISPLAPLLSFSSSVLNFPAQQIGTSSTAQTIAVQNPGTSTLNISGVQITGTNGASFQATNTCGNSLAAGANCAVSVIFAPVANGAQTAGLAFSDNAADSPQSVSLSGSSSTIGLGPASGASTSATVAAGGTAKYNLVIGGSGISGMAAITCTGAPQGASCSAPSGLSLSATSVSSLTVTVTTTAGNSEAAVPGGISPFLAVFVLGFLVWQGLQKTKIPARCVRALPVLALLLFCSCGGGNSGTQTTTNGTPAGQYTVTVSATAGSATQSLKLNLTVQ